VTVAVNAEHGFVDSVQITLANLPAGVTSNPASPFTISAGANVSVILGAAVTTGTGSSTITAQGVSGSLSHSATFALSIQGSVLAALPRTTYTRTDAVPLADDPPSEPHHRHIVYDAANHHVFVANRAMNRVEVFSTSNQLPGIGVGARVAQIDVPGASSADLSPDGATVWVGTITEQIVAIDTTLLQVQSRYFVQPMSPVPNATFDRPEEILILTGGNCLTRLRQSSAARAILALWNPANSAPTSLMFVVPDGLGPMARTGDHTKALVAAGDASGNLSVLNSDGTLLTGPFAIGDGTIPVVAANLDGSRFAIVLVSNGGAQIILLDGALHQIAMQPSAGIRSLLFSRDGMLLYASQSAAISPAIQVFDGQTLETIGQVPDASIQGVQSEVEDIDETQLLFGIANRGVSFVDAAKPGVLPTSAPSFIFPPVIQPAEGFAAGGTSAVIAGENIEATATVIFGSQAAISATVASPAQIQVTSPPNAANGAVNVAAYFPSGWLALAPDGFSYGPQILQALPNAVSSLGGDIVQVYGYGFGSDANPPTVTIGGATATIQKIENVAAIEPSLGLDSTYPFPLECITMKTPFGTSGKADIVVASANGSAIASRAIEYLQSVQVNANPGLYKFLLYDQGRQFIYLSADDKIDVFDLKAGAFKPGGLPVYCPSRMLAGPCPDADLRGLALTPDGTQLVVADFGSQNIFLLDPDVPGMVSYVPVNAPGFGPARVVATSTQTAFVSLVPIASAPGPCTGCLSQLNLAASTPTIQPAPQPEVSTMTGTPLLQADATGDHVFLSFAAVSGGSEALWTAAAPNDFTNFSANEFVSDAAASADGTMFATIANGATEMRDVALHLVANRTARELEQFSAGVSVPGLALHPSGALVYQPFLNGPAPLETSTPAPNPNLRGGVDIFDAHSGRLRLRIVLPEPLAARSNDIDGLHAQFLTVDETGQRIFAITNSGLTVVRLANVPLAIGTIVPINGPAAGGTSITIRGSGFQTGTTASLNGKKGAVTFIDANTLRLVTPAVTSGPQQLALANPDGESTSLDGAYIAN